MKIKSFLSRYRKALVLEGAGVLLLICGGTVYYKTQSTIPNAYKTIQISKSTNNSYKKTLNKQVLSAINSHWNGRKSKMVVNVNEGKVDNKLKKVAENSDGVFNNELTQTNKNSVPINIFSIMQKGQKSQGAKDKPLVYTEDILEKNTGTHAIFERVYLQPKKYVNKNNYFLSQTLMTKDAANLYKSNLRNTIAKVENSNAKGFVYQVIPIYKQLDDKVPVGFAIQGIGVQKFKEGKVVGKKIVNKKGKLLNFQYNFYLRNVQEGYTINYHTGDVSLN